MGDRSEERRSPTGEELAVTDAANSGAAATDAADTGPGRSG
jgi:hypothetical protein